MNPALLLVLAVGGLWLARRGREQGNPPRRNPRRRNPVTDADRRQLEAARALSQEFHGSPDHVVELGTRERRLPRYAVEAGTLTDFTYRPPAGSEKADADWRHEAGDRGPLARKARRKPLLAADPASGRPIILPDGSPMRLSGRGFEG